MLNLTPQYVVLDEKGPDHAKCFEVCVEIGARRFESTWGPSKKEAEQLAALQALVELELAERTPAGDVRLLTADGVS
jgi:ribonuclease-3